MTYCIGMLLEAGLLMMADTRTNAGVDNISLYKKLHITETADRFIAVVTAGNLSVTQATLSKVAEGVVGADGETLETLASVPSLFRAAQLVGRVLHQTRVEIGAPLAAEGIDDSATLLLGGRVGQGALQLFMIYDAGNAIECQRDTPYLQIGEFKYGKPILDRALDYGTPMDEAVKIGLISFDSTMRSNLAVGLPIDMLILPRDRQAVPEMIRIQRDDPYFAEVSQLWGAKLREARATIPRPPFIGAAGATRGI